jgi:hypothetical protein
MVHSDPDANVNRAVVCLRSIPGMIEGTSPEDLANDNAHSVVLHEDRGRVGYPRTVIKLHRE